MNSTVLYLAKYGRLATSLGGRFALTQLQRARLAAGECVHRIVAEHHYRQRCRARNAAVQRGVPPIWRIAR